MTIFSEKEMRTDQFKSRTTSNFKNAPWWFVIILAIFMTFVSFFCILLPGFHEKVIWHPPAYNEINWINGTIISNRKSERYPYTLQGSNGSIYSINCYPGGARYNDCLGPAGLLAYNKNLPARIGIFYIKYNKKRGVFAIDAIINGDHVLKYCDQYNVLRQFSDVKNQEWGFPIGRFIIFSFGMGWLVFGISSKIAGDLTVLNRQNRR